MGSFFGLRLGGACGIRAAGAGIGLMDLILSDLGPARSLGSFGCGVFAGGALVERASFPKLVVSKVASEHREEHRRRRDLRADSRGWKRLDWMGEFAGAER